MSLENLKSDIRRWGLVRSLFNRILRRINQYLGIHIHVVRTADMSDNPQYPSIPANISLRLIPPTELPEVTANPALRLSPAFVNSAIERGDLAFGAFDGPELVSYVWRTLTQAPHHDDIWVRVTRPHCYAYNSFTLPNYRGQKISPAVHLLSDTEMFKRGYTKRAGFIALANSASLSMGKHMGSRRIGYAGYVNWFGWFIPFRTNAVRNICFEFFQRK